VGYTAGGTFEGGVSISTPSVAGRDRAGVVLYGILLGVYGTGWFIGLA
jgi:hypothetical protein